MHVIEKKTVITLMIEDILTITWKGLRNGDGYMLLHVVQYACAVLMELTQYRGTTETTRRPKMVTKKVPMSFVPLEDLPLV